MARFVLWVLLFLVQVAGLSAITRFYGMHVDALHLLIFATMALGGVVALGFFAAMARGIVSGAQWYPKR